MSTMLALSQQTLYPEHLGGDSGRWRGVHVAASQHILSKLGLVLRSPAPHEFFARQEIYFALSISRFTAAEKVVCSGGHYALSRGLRPPKHDGKMPDVIFAGPRNKPYHRKKKFRISDKIFRR